MAPAAMALGSNAGGQGLLGFYHSCIPGAQLIHWLVVGAQVFLALSEECSEETGELYKKFYVEDVGGVSPHK